MPRIGRAYRIVGLLSVILLVSGCMIGTIRPFVNAKNLGPESEGEKRLWHAANKIETTLRTSGQIYDDPAPTSSLQSITDRLYPEFDGKIKVNILKAPVLNAFVLPNGSIYVNTGLIAALENEAQIATILAHEGVHFVNKHSVLQRRNYHNTVGASWALSLLGIPLLSEIISASSIFGYSQQLENEADKQGYHRLRDAGYDVREAPKTFQHLVVEAKANKVPEPFFFSTHPKLENRIKSFAELEAKTIHHGGDVKAEKFQQHVAALRPTVLEAKISAGKYDSVIAVLTQNDLMPLYGDQGDFYLAEAYRLRNQSNDLENAIKAYERVVSKNPEFAPVYKSLGMVCLKAKQYEKAVINFERYLELRPDDKDNAFVRQYLKQAKNGAEKT